MSIVHCQLSIKFQFSYPLFSTDSRNQTESKRENEVNILVLSCGTGGGHNSAAAAVKEEMLSRGHSVTMLNPLELCGRKVAGRVDNAYISLAQTVPGAFGAIYDLGNAYRRLPWRSPVYYANSHASYALAAYLAENPVDAIVMSHLFPAEILTYLRLHGTPVPKTIFITTDYTCIPFMEECVCDAYVIPAKELIGDFTTRGIPEDRIYPLGIPVRKGFRERQSRQQAKEALGLDQEKRYLLVSGGSIGAGKLEKALGLLCDITKGTDFSPIVICGNNTSVLGHLEKRYGSQVRLLGQTDRMAEYLRACDLYFTKPGGLSTTEAAVMEVPLALLPPIPGCETRNRRFYTETGMAEAVEPNEGDLQRVLSLLDSPAHWERMMENQRRVIPKDAAQRICDLATGQGPDPSRDEPGL